MTAFINQFWPIIAWFVAIVLILALNRGAALIDKHRKIELHKIKRRTLINRNYRGMK